MGKNQSILNRTKVLFKANGLEKEFADLGMDAAKYDGKIATIEYLATATEEGDKNFEYYTITFADYTEFKAVNGSHLTPVGFTAQERINSTLKAWSQLR